MKCNRQTDTDLDRFEWPFKNHDDNGIDKEAWHTKQNQAKLTEPGGQTKHYENPELINFIWAREERSQNQKNSISVPILHKA